MSVERVNQAIEAWKDGKTVYELLSAFPELSEATVFGICGVWEYNRLITAKQIWDGTHKLPNGARAGEIRQAILSARKE